jgi:YHS domain-containing protein
MGFFVRLIRLVFWVLIVSWVIQTVARLFGGRNRPATPQAHSAGDEQPAIGRKRLVKDPICGMHLAEELALPVSANGETQFFCSPECRAKYESSVLRRVANA